MNGATTNIDITNEKVLLRIAEEVKRTNKPKALRKGSTVLAVVVPIKKHAARLKKNTAHKFHQSLGGWKGLVDITAFKKHIKESRSSNRPDITL